jgi:hypothetical protein
VGALCREHVCTVSITFEFSYSMSREICKSGTVARQPHLFKCPTRSTLMLRKHSSHTVLIDGRFCMKRADKLARILLSSRVPCYNAETALKQAASFLVLSRGLIAGPTQTAIFELSSHCLSAQKMCDARNRGRQQIWERHANMTVGFDAYYASVFMACLQPGYYHSIPSLLHISLGHWLVASSQGPENMPNHCRHADTDVDPSTNRCATALR